MAIGGVKDLIKEIKKRVGKAPVSNSMITSYMTVFIQSGDVKRGYQYNRGYRNYRIVDTFEAPKQVTVPEPDFLGDCSLIIVDELKARAEEVMKQKFLVYYEFYKKCLVISDDKAETAYITFNELIGDYEIHYCKSFLLEKVVTDALIMATSDNDFDIEELMVKSVLFVFMHEMMHALRYHMRNQQALSNGINGEIINIMGDSFINTELQKSIGIPCLANCIDSTVSFKGTLKMALKGRDLAKDVNEWLNHLTGTRVENGSCSNDWKLAKGDEAVISITVPAQAQRDVFGENSNIYIMEVTKFLSKYLNAKSAESGSGRGKESSDNNSSGSSSDSSSDSNSSDNSQSNSSSGDSGDSGGSSSGSSNGQSSGSSQGKSEPSSGDSGSGDGGSGGSEKKKAEESLNNDKAKSKAQTILEDAINQAKSKMGEGDPSSDLVKSIGADKLARNFGNVQTWKAKLNRFLNECMGTTERYNSELANARIEGQYGREEDVNVPKRIVLVIDCSGSMGPNTFKKCLNEIENFLKANKYKRIEIDVIYFGTTAFDFKTKITNNLVKEIIAHYKGLGGTNLAEGIKIVMQKYRKFDLLITFTDGYIESTPSKECQPFMRKNCNRLLWVLTDACYVNSIKNYDSGCQRRIIKMI